MFENEMKEEKWVNLADVAEHLSVSLDTIRAWLKSGKKPTYKAGKQYNFGYRKLTIC